eukprot:c21915_g1_i1 orf=72-524(+)
MANQATIMMFFFLSFAIFLAFSDGHSANEKAPLTSLDKSQEKVAEVKANYYDNDGGQKVWCVGKPAAEDLYLRRNIDYACGEGGVDCRLIQEGGTCFLPNSPIAHASYAMNLYYQKNGRNWWNCHFNNTGLVVFTDPSFGNCKYTAQWRM